MKKLLEVVIEDDGKVRFETDFDAGKDPASILDTVPLLATAMATTLWGGNEMSVLAAIRALAIADLGLCADRSGMIRLLDYNSARLEEAMEATKEELRRAGVVIHTFSPGTGAKGPHS